MSSMAIFLFCAALQLCKAYELPELRVVGGLPAPPYLFPFAAAILDPWYPGGSQFCTGSIVGSRWILSAAHCFDNKKDITLEVLVGTTDITSNEGSRHPVIKVYIHPMYRRSPAILEHDIAMLLLDEPIRYSPAVLPIALGSLPPGEGLPVLALGWGRITSGLIPPVKSPQLKYVALETMGVEECQRRHLKVGNLVHKDMHICGWGGVGMTLCFGDSGGPLVDYQQTMQVGIFSGLQDCTGNYPVLFTKVETYLPWIRNLTHSLRRKRKQKMIFY